jgi:hypothetical protein
MRSLRYIVPSAPYYVKEIAMQLSTLQVSDLQDQIPDLYARFRDRIPWLEAIGIGKKTIQGTRTERDALVFFVGHKLSKDALDEDSGIPPIVTVNLKGQAVQLETDVVEMQPFKLLQLSRCVREWPTKGGNCISPWGAGWTGTLGGVIRNPWSGKYYIVSNAHVLAGFNQFQPGHPIVQPMHGPVIAHLARATMFTPGSVVRSDAAVAEAVNNNDVDPFIYGIGKPTGVTEPFEGMRVQKSGARTSWSSGVIRYIGVAISLLGVYQIANVFLTDRMSDVGDSGSLVLDDARQVVGLVFSENEQYTAACTITAVVADLDLFNWEWTFS